MTYKIDRLFGSATRVALLSKLLANTGRSFYIRELSRELHIPYSMLYKEEKNLSELGIVRERRVGNTVMLSINLSLQYLPELRGLILKTAGFADVVRGALYSFNGVRFALVYGSFARGEESEHSDIDLLIIGSVDHDALAKSISKVEGALGREINYIVWSPAELKKRVKDQHPLIANIAKGPVIMLIGAENEFREFVER